MSETEKTPKLQKVTKIAELNYVIKVATVVQLHTCLPSLRPAIHTPNLMWESW